MPYGPEWKACWKLFTTSQLYATLVRKMAGSSILSVAYGFDVNVVQDSVYTYNAEKALDGLIAASIPGSFLVDYLPWLKYIPSWVPGASLQCQARIWKADMEKLLHGPFAATKSSLIEGGVDPCFVTRCFEQLGDPNSNVERMIEQTSGTIISSRPPAGSTDTTIIALTNFFLAMVKYPEYQKKAQHELDRVIGNDRLPDFSDKSSLPYIQAIVNEVLRWQPVNPLVLAHLSNIQRISNP
ncbi:cytochrome P450 [Gymnopus androsaceus JB14]|uniref:Cytochrome P450 n=1 Tax=Gymnopus androsaceus JB14 TaxID=1447944 RepID=A0A6A4I9V0_9AGAR|nr:cytochrome P450 [Gymnopus androsaceus JB14]